MIHRAEIEPYFAEEARKRMLAGVKSDPEENVPQGNSRKPQARDQAAAAVGVSGKTGRVIAHPTGKDTLHGQMVRLFGYLGAKHCAQVVQPALHHRLAARCPRRREGMWRGAGR